MSFCTSLLVWLDIPWVSFVLLLPEKLNRAYIECITEGNVLLRYLYYSSEQYNAHSDWLKKRVYQSTKRGAPNSLLWKLESSEWRINGFFIIKLLKKPLLLLLCYKALEKWGGTLNYVSCSPYISFVPQPGAFYVIYNRTEHSQGIC